MNKFKDIIETGYGLIEVGQHEDKRGSLCFAEWTDLPFEPKRIFWIHDVKSGQSRGKHAHKECEEVVFAVSGSFDMFVDNGKEQATFHIDCPNKGIYIGKGVWCELKNFQPGTVCVVVANMEYMHHGYINSYEEFKTISAE